jgi:hypothetical protein
MTATSEQELLLIGETWAPAIAGTVRDVLDPASGEVIAQVADASGPTSTPRWLGPGRCSTTGPGPACRVRSGRGSCGGSLT